MSKHEEHLDHPADDAVRIADYVEQIFQLDKVLNLFSDVQRTGFEYRQYAERKAEVLTELNELLGRKQLVIQSLRSEAA